MKTKENILAETPSSANRPRWRTVTKRDGMWLGGLAVFALAALVGWKPLEHELAMFLVLRSDGPSESALSELADGSGNQSGNLTRMWRSGNLTARVFVLNYLKTNLHKEPPLAGQMEAIVAEATRDPDVDVREPAFNILAQSKRPESLALLRQSLADPDPAVRVLALQQFHQVADSNDVPIAISLLADSDPRVVVQASSLLRKVTGFDSGIRVSDALPNFIRSDDGTSPPPPNLETIQQGVQRWREWWNSNRAEFSESGASPRTTTTALPVKDFALEDLDGRLVQLASFRGKAVLFCFWKIGDARSSNDLAVLKQLQEQEGQRLAVVGIAFDSAVGPQDECGEEHGGQSHHDHAHMMHMTNAGPMSLHCAVSDLTASAQIQFPVLLDKNGTAPFRFNVQEIPTYILIDADGHLRRRFVGSRNLAVFKAMVDEAATPTTLSKLDR